jgi:hypothetical protein
MIKTLCAATFLSYAAYALARGVGIPHWVNQATRKIPADSCDIAALVFVAIVLLHQK